MPRQYSPHYQQTRITGFYTKKSHGKRKVIPISAHSGKRRTGKTMTVATKIQPTQPKREIYNPPPYHVDSDANIKMWEGYRKNYEEGKLNYLKHLSKEERMQKYRERLVSNRVSLTLGRDFGEDTDVYLKRSGWKKWDDWAKAEVDKIDAEKSLIKSEKAAVKDERQGAKDYTTMAKEAKKIGDKKAAKVFKEHAKDEKRHEKEDKAILAEKEKKTGVTVEYHEIEQKPSTHTGGSGRDMPTKDEIEEKALRMYMADNHNNENVTTTPERHELIEEGYIKAAQHNLMATGEQNDMEKAYIDNLIQDLADHGDIAEIHRM